MTGTTWSWSVDSLVHKVVLALLSPYPTTTYLKRNLSRKFLPVDFMMSNLHPQLRSSILPRMLKDGTTRMLSLLSQRLMTSLELRGPNMSLTVAPPGHGTLYQ